MENFTPFASTLGGLLIGLSAAIVLHGLGRIAGISGIFGGLLFRTTGDVAWRVAFVAGLLVSGLTMARLRPSMFETADLASLPLVAIAGLLVGFGTRMGNGCTSGHGVCGLSRLSPRSLVATITFMTTGGLTVFVGRHLLGGGG